MYSLSTRLTHAGSFLNLLPMKLIQHEFGFSIEGRSYASNTETALRLKCIQESCSETDFKTGHTLEDDTLR